MRVNRVSGRMQAPSAGSARAQGLGCSGQRGPNVERTLKNLVLIRAKHLAEGVTTPTFLADAEGTLIFYNEPAEALVGKTFADTGPMPAQVWRDRLDVRTKEGDPFPLDDMPGWMALQRHRPTLGHIRFRAFDGTDRLIAVCGIPLFTHPDRFEGGLIIFWDED